MIQAPNKKPNPAFGPPLLVTAMVVVQLGAAMSLPLADRMGTAATVWIRLLFAAAFILVLTRAPWRAMTKKALCLVLPLGVATAGMMGFYIAAAQRIDLGLVSAISFLGPLGVAVTTGSGRTRYLWPALAACGVACMTDPWRSTPDIPGILLALAAGACWAGYIVLSKGASRLLSGPQTLAFTLPVAALMMTVPALTMAGLGNFVPEDLLALGFLAALAPTIPFVLELAAIRHMRSAAFGVMMSLEPAVSLLIGVLILHQFPSLLQVLGMSLVVIAAASVQRRAVPKGRRSSTNVPQKVRTTGPVPR